MNSRAAGHPACVHIHRHLAGLALPGGGFGAIGVVLGVLGWVTAASRQRGCRVKPAETNGALAELHRRLFRGELLWEQLDPGFFATDASTSHATTFTQYN
jgi:hypothetical protein